jgi:hypothetical protein
VGEQLKADGAGSEPPPVTIPPVDTTLMLFPEADDPEELLTPTEVVRTPGAIVKFMTATVPFEIVVVFRPKLKHVIVPEPAKQLTVLFAATAADPTTAEIAVTLLAGYVKVHSTADGSLPVGEVRFRFRDTVPLELALPDNKFKTSVCPKEACAAIKKENISRGAVLFFMKSSQSINT